MTEYFQVGVITNTHGLAGEVKVYPTTDELSRFRKLKEVILEPEKENLTLHVTGVKYVKNMVVLRFQEFTSIDEVQRLRQKGLYVSRENAIPLNEDEYYIPDLIGLSVFTEEGEELGLLKDVLQTGANDVYIVENQGKELMIPAIGDCVKSVDLDEQKMVVHLLPGLREL